MKLWIYDRSRDWCAALAVVCAETEEQAARILAEKGFARDLAEARRTVERLTPDDEPGLVAGIRNEAVDTT